MNNWQLLALLICEAVVVQSLRLPMVQVASKPSINQQSIISQPDLQYTELGLSGATKPAKVPQKRSVTGQGSKFRKPKLEKKRVGVTESANGALRNKAQVRALFQDANKKAKKGQHRAARDLLRRCLDLDPTDGHSWLALGRAEQQQGHFDRARSIFQQATDKHCANNVHIWQAWAVLESKCGNVSRARELFEAALSLDNHNAYVCHAWGLLEQRHGNFDLARKLYLTAFSKRPQAQVCVALGEMEYQTGSIENARQVLELGCEVCRSGVADILVAWAAIEEQVAASAAAKPKLYDETQGGSLSDEKPEEFKKEEALCHKRAALLLAKAQEMEPDSVKVVMAIASLEARRGKIDRIREIFEAAEKRGIRHKNGAMYNMWANQEAKAGNVEEAIEVLERGRTQLPFDHTLPQAQGALESKRKNFEAARELYHVSLCLRPHGPTYCAWAIMEQKLNHIDRARELFQAGLQAAPFHGPLYNAYGALEVKMGNTTSARNILEEGIKKCKTKDGVGENLSSIWQGLGKLELSDNNPNKARKCFQKGLEALQDGKSGDDVSFLLHSLGMLELHTHRVTEAVEAFSKGTQKYPNNSQLLLGQALCQVRLGFVDEARHFFRRAVTADRKHAHAWQAWGVMERSMGNFQVAQMLYENGLKSNPRHGALWQAYGLMMAMDLEDYEKATLLLGKGLQYAPDHIFLYQTLAVLQMKEGNLEQADRLIRSAILRDPKHGACWVAYAVLEEKKGNLDKARVIYQQGLKYDPKHAALYRSYAALEERDQRWQRARELLRRGMEVVPNEAKLYHSAALLEAKLGNIQGLAELNKIAAVRFSQDIPSRTGEEYLERVEALEQNALNTELNELHADELPSESS